LFAAIKGGCGFSVPFDAGVSPTDCTLSVSFFLTATAMSSTEAGSLGFGTILKTMISKPPINAKMTMVHNTLNENLDLEKNPRLSTATPIGTKPEDKHGFQRKTYGNGPDNHADASPRKWIVGE